MSTESSFLNVSFAAKPQGSAKLNAVCQQLHLKQYFRFRAPAGKTAEQDSTCLDLKRFWQVLSADGKPRRHRSFLALVSDTDAYIRQEIPIAIIGYKNKEEKEQAIQKGIHEAGASMFLGYSFLSGMTWTKLYRAYITLDPKYMWMCTMVVEDAPVHLYFDFDACVSKDPARQNTAAQTLANQVQGQEEAVKQEFMSTFSEFFRQTFKREANWNGLHWETASDADAGKFSLHAHLISEAFVDIITCDDSCKHTQIISTNKAQLVRSHGSNEKTRLCLTMPCTPPIVRFV